jgi:hypothetical protein
MNPKRHITEDCGNRGISVVYAADNLQPLSFFCAHGQDLHHLLLALL